MIKTILQKIWQRERPWEEYSSELLDFEREEKNLKEIFSANYLQISDKEIKKNESLISQFFEKNKVKLLVPMREKEKTIKILLKYALKRIPQSSILIVDDGSKKEVLEEIKKFEKVKLINKEKILKAIEWKKLLPILNLRKIPSGKGTAVMAGYLFAYFESKKKKENFWIFQTDADIKNQKEFKPLEYLAFGIIKHPEAFQIKMAKSGRNNEPHMAVRSALVILEDLKKVIPTKEGIEISRRASELFENLAKYKWILSGNFAIPRKIVFERPFATGYLDETLCCAFVEDLAKKENGFSVQVSNPNPCRDGQNSFEKENLIIQTAANFVMILLLAKKPVCDWKIEDIAFINKNLMSKIKPLVFIPPKGNEGPVIIKNVGNERILPSIKMMEENGLIDFEKVERLFFSSQNEE